MIRPLWYDASKWNPGLSPAALKAAGAHGLITRSGTGNSYIDPTFLANYQGAGTAGLLRSSYHNLVPTQPALGQVNKWYEAHPALDVVPRFLSIELDYGAPATQIAARAWEVSEIVKSRDGRRPGIYSRKGLLDPWLVTWTVTMKNEHEYWLAQYHATPGVEHPGPPATPVGVLPSKVVLHQVSDLIPPPPGGATSNALDVDRWNLGDEAAMYAYINANWGPAAPPDPPAPIEPVIPLGKLKVTGVTTYLNVRALPDAGSTDLGELYKNTVVPVVAKSNGWSLISGWIKDEFTTPV